MICGATRLRIAPRREKWFMSVIAATWKGKCPDPLEWSVKHEERTRTTGRRKLAGEKAGYDGCALSQIWAGGPQGSLRVRCGPVAVVEGTSAQGCGQGP